MTNRSTVLDKQHSNNEYPILVAQQGPLEGQRWNIFKEIIIGRAAECNIQIDDRQISRFHARVAQDGHTHAVSLEDLGSKNGTFFGGNQIDQPIILQDGDVFQVSMLQKFVFYTTDATVPLEDMPVFGSKKAQGILLDRKSRRVWVGNRELLPPLSVPQFRLLEALSEQPGLVVSREKLVDTIWGREQSEGVSEQALDALIRRLRDRLSDVDANHNYIVTVRGHGLRLENK